MHVLKLLSRPIAFHRCLVSLTDSVLAALMLSQAVYWSERTQDPAGWFFKTQEDWTLETGLSRREQETAREILRKSGFWSEERRGLPAKLYYQIDLEALAHALQIGGIRQSSMAESANLEWRNAPDKHGASRHSFNTEITTEITTRQSQELLSRNPVGSGSVQELTLGKNTTEQSKELVSRLSAADLENLKISGII